jgi:AmmeMemoRadiSam system protein B
MLVFSAIMPHAPILIPTIGRDNLKKLKKTAAALDLLTESFAEAAPEMVIIISPHGDLNHEAFTINALPNYEMNFEEFGDFETRQTFRGDLEFANRFKEQVETNQPLNLYSEATLDHGVSVPLYFLLRSAVNFTLVPLNYSFLDLPAHFNFGGALGEAIARSDKRIALVASGDLSHCLTKDAPAGFSPHAREFDKRVIQLLKQKKVEQLASFDRELIADAHDCGLRSFVLAAGVLAPMNYEFEVLSYESPFGVGHLVGEFKLK